jgi:hypothetical protein
MFKLSKAELESYSVALRDRLCLIARRLAPPSRSHLGFSAEDGVLDVMVAVTEYLQDGVPLKPFPEHNFPILTLVDVTRYACRRLRANYGKASKADVREAVWTTRRKHEIFLAVFGEPPPDEHEYYDHKFFDDLTRAVEKDALAYQLVVLILNCHIVPGTHDLDVCDNTAIALELDCEPADVRLARNRIHTVKNRLIAERQGEGPKK